MRSEESVSDRYGSNKGASVHTVGVLGENWEKGDESLYQMAEKFPVAGKEWTSQRIQLQDSIYLNCLTTMRNFENSKRKATHWTQIGKEVKLYGSHRSCIKPNRSHIKT